MSPAPSRSWLPALASSLEPAPGFRGPDSGEPRPGRLLACSVAGAGVAWRPVATLGPLSALVPLCPQASLARQLCKQHIIAGQHMLEEPGTQQTRRWWTLAGQEITVTFNRFTVRRATPARGPGSPRWRTPPGQRCGGGTEPRHTRLAPGADEPEASRLGRDTPTSTKRTPSRRLPSTRPTTRRPTASSTWSPTCSGSPHQSSPRTPR